MRLLLFRSCLLLFCSCQDNPFANPLTDVKNTASPSTQPAITRHEIKDRKSWAYFLQHLPEKDGPVLDYQGNPVEAQYKNYRLINYDVGNRDLQQCADALIRLRAEFLFSQGRIADISFRFTSGHAYSFLDYCSGKRPVPRGRSVVFTDADPVNPTYKNLPLS